MSIAYVDGLIDAVRAEASNLQNSYGATAASINADTTLSAEGKAQRRNAALAEAKAQMEELKAKELKLIDDEISRLESQLDAKSGNSSSDIIAFRDAQDRADRIEDWTEANRILERALRTNDQTLAHAIFRRALESRWRSTIDAFTTANPGLAEVAKDLGVWTKFREPDMNRALAYSIGWR